MARYHINSAGKSAQCHADLRGCPLGGDHYDSEEDAAMASFEAERARQADPFGKGHIEVRQLEEGIIKSPTVAVLPAGRYFVGDPASSAVLAAENSNAGAMATYHAAGFLAARSVRDLARSI